MLCSIYKITNRINNKIYIGQTWNNINYRFSSHKSPNRHWCVKLVNAFNKHGRDNFTINLITVCATQEAADYWERYFIKSYDCIRSGYNILEGGSRGKLPASTRAKISLSLIGNKRGLGNKNGLDKKNGLGNKSNLGQKQSEETKAKRSAALKGRKQSEETIAKRSASMIGKNKGKPAPNKGKKASEETRRKQSLAHMGKKPSNAGIPRSEETKKKISDSLKKRFNPIE